MKIYVEGIWIGDLIYDSYIKYYSVPTIDIKSENFKLFFNECIYVFYFWLDYFTKNPVNTVIGSHSVYYSAIPLRIGVKRAWMFFKLIFIMSIDCRKKLFCL